MTHTSGLKVIAAIKRVDQRSWLTICLTNNIFDTQVCETLLLGHSTNHGGDSVGLLHDCEVVHSVSEWLILWRIGFLMAVRIMKIRNNKLLQFRFYSHIFSQFLTCIGSSYWSKEDRITIVHKSLCSSGEKDYETKVAKPISGKFQGHLPILPSIRAGVACSFKQNYTNV